MSLKNNISRENEENINSEVPKSLLRKKIGSSLGITAIIVSIGSFFTSMAVVEEWVAAESWIAVTLPSFLFLLTSLVWIAIVGKSDYGIYGFKKSNKDTRFQDYGLASLLGLSVGAIFEFSLFLINPSYYGTQVVNLSLWQTIGIICILASIAEELVFRGLIYGHCIALLERKKTFGSISISTSNFIAAICFGIIHFVLIMQGVPIFNVILTVFFAMLLGVIAGWYREKVGNIIPAIIVHMSGNIGATVIGLILG